MLLFRNFYLFSYEAGLSGLQSSMPCLFQHQSCQTTAGIGPGIDADSGGVDFYIVTDAVSVDDHFLKRGLPVHKGMTNPQAIPVILLIERKGGIHSGMDEVIITAAEPGGHPGQKIPVGLGELGDEITLQLLQPLGRRDAAALERNPVTGQRSEAAIGQPAFANSKIAEEAQKAFFVIAEQENRGQGAVQGAHHPLQHALGVGATVDVITQKNQPRLALVTDQIGFNQGQQPVEQIAAAMNVPNRINPLTGGESGRGGRFGGIQGFF